MKFVQLDDAFGSFVKVTHGSGHIALLRCPSAGEFEGVQQVAGAGAEGSQRVS